MKKEIKSKKEYYIEFTDDECEKLNIKEGDKFSFEESEGGFTMQKYAELEIDLSEFNREILEFLITESVQKDKTISEVIEEVLENAVKHFENEK